MSVDPKYFPAARQISEMNARFHNLQDHMTDLLEEMTSMQAILYNATMSFADTTHKSIKKPWGSEEILELNPKYALKLLRIKAGEEISLQYHAVKHETMHCIEGQGSIMVDEDITSLYPGTTVVVLPKAIHKVRAVKDLLIIEASTPELDDVIRLKDKYGRETELPDNLQHRRDTGPDNITPGS